MMKKPSYESRCKTFFTALCGSFPSPFSSCAVKCSMIVDSNQSAELRTSFRKMSSLNISTKMP